MLKPVPDLDTVDRNTPQRRQTTERSPLAKAQPDACSSFSISLINTSIYGNHDVVPVILQ